MGKALPFLQSVEFLTNCFSKAQKKLKDARDIGLDKVNESFVSDFDSLGSTKYLDP